MKAETQDLLHDYYSALNARDMPALLELLHEDIVHDLGQSRREFGKTAFARFLEHTAARCQKHLFDIEIMVNDDGSRAAAEFVVLGSYLAGSQCPESAPGQTFRLPGGAFFEIHRGKITRISNYSGLQEWLAQVIAADPPTETGDEQTAAGAVAPRTYPAASGR
jgi:steroid delta-isomerase-like uncharacterized protein